MAGRLRENGDSGDGLALAEPIVGWITTALWALCLAIRIVVFTHAGAPTLA